MPSLPTPRGRRAPAPPVSFHFTGMAELGEVIRGLAVMAGSGMIDLRRLSDLLTKLSFAMAELTDEPWPSDEHVYSAEVDPADWPAWTDQVIGYTLAEDGGEA